MNWICTKICTKSVLCENFCTKIYQKKVNYSSLAQYKYHIYMVNIPGPVFTNSNTAADVLILEGMHVSWRRAQSTSVACMTGIMQYIQA